MDGYPSTRLPLLLAAHQYRFARDTEALSRYLIDIDAVGWDDLGDDLLDGAPADLRAVLSADQLGPGRLMANVFTADGRPPRRMVVDESTARDSDLQWAYVLHPLGIEVVSLTVDSRGPVVGWTTDPLVSFSDEPHLWGRDLPIPLAAPQPPPALTATRTTPAGPPPVRRSSHR
ncbi:hypothetical protein OG900_09780 [Streptomyces sp. NBC_00433]